MTETVLEVASEIVSAFIFDAAIIFVPKNASVSVFKLLLFLLLKMLLLFIIQCIIVRLFPYVYV
jgi:hypothetical protein